MREAKGAGLLNRDATAWFKGLAIIMVILSHFAEWWTWFYTEQGTSELIRDGISRLGPYGVAIFFLFSGYGLAKSAGKRRIGIRFILKRIVNVYIPYLIMVVLITLLSGGFESKEDIRKIFYGQDFWYMTVLFSFYLAFMAIWLVFDHYQVRAILLVIFTYWYSNHLYQQGEYDFWFISNIAFAIGALLALYEPKVKKVMDKMGILFVLLFGAGSVMVVRSALYVEHVWEEPVHEIWSRIIAVTIFTLFIASLSAIWKWYGPVLPILGKYSLYFYLSHTFLFMWAINFFEYEMSINFAIAAIIILAVSVLVGRVIDLVIKPIGKWLVQS